MPKITDYQATDIAQLLAAKTIDASNGVLFSDGEAIPPETRNRTIMIGLGGTGMKTIDHVKGVISRRLDSTWTKYIAFLGIDSDPNEISNMKHLRAPEDNFVCTTVPGANERLQTPAFPAAWNQFVDPSTRHLVPNLATDGANQTRYIGKMKAHDKMSGSPGVDEQIVAALTSIRGKRLAPLTAGGDKPGRYQIYVVGGACGGTGSGTFLEMPALIRKALGAGDQIQIHGFLYLPDTLTALVPHDKAQLEANGYGTLKELDYFQGMHMREGYSDYFAYNAESGNVIEMNFKEGFFNMPYLVGTLNGAAIDSANRARETIAEFLISLLGKIETGADDFPVDSFISNAIAKENVKEKNPGSPFREAVGQHHEFPNRYAAIGFASAAAPRKIARAYAISKSCKAAGIHTVTKEERQAYAGGEALAPFRDVDDLLGAAEGTSHAAKIVEPLEKILPMIHTGMFTMRSNLNLPEIKWDGIRKNEYDTPSNVNMVNNFVKRFSDVAAMKPIEDALNEAIKMVAQNIRDYVRKEGPLAYANLYAGRFAKDHTGYGTGVGVMLQNLMDGKNMRTGELFPWANPEEADAALRQQREYISKMAVGPIAAVADAGRRVQAASKWTLDYERTVNARIIKARRDIFLGATAKIAELIVRPQAALADDIKAFGNLLNALSDIYTKHGGSLDKYETFANVKDSSTEVNIAAVNQTSYEWLKNRADASAKNVNALNFRNAIIDNFFGTDEDGLPNRKKWLDVPQKLVKVTGGVVQLNNEAAPVPARELFDSIISKEMGDDTNVTVDVFFQQMAVQNQDVNQIAIEILRDLQANSQLLFNGDIPEGRKSQYIMYPATLDNTPVGTDGVTVGSILKSVAQSLFGGSVTIYGSSNASSIVMYQMATPFEVYRLKELEEWERQYEAKMQSGGMGMFLHGYSPLVEEKFENLMVSYKQLVAWKDFPSITKYTNAITERDPATGKVSREGELRLELRKLIQEAKKLGVLYVEQDIDNKYYINRVHCDRSVEKWSVDVAAIAANEKGLLPLGRELAIEVASQNGKTIEEVTKRVRLLKAGVLQDAVPTEELAWEYAEKVLRKHPRMHQEVKETVEKFAVFAKAILEHNEKVLQKFNPARMLKMIQGQVLYLDPTGAWKLRKSNGGPDKMIVNLSDANLNMLKMISGRDYSMVVNGLKGYYLYTKLMAAYNAADMRGESIGASLELAKKRLESMMNEGNMDGLQKGIDAMTFIMAEREALEAKNARLDEVEDGQEPWESFVNAMREINVIDPNVIKGIREFYNRIIFMDMI